MAAKDTDKTQFIAQGVTVNSGVRLGSGLHPGMDCVRGADVETWAVGTGASCLLLTHSPTPRGARTDISTLTPTAQCLPSGRV